MRNLIDLIHGSTGNSFSLLDLQLLLEGREDGITKKFVPEIVRRPGLLNQPAHVRTLIDPFMPALGPDATLEDSQIATAKAIIGFLMSRDPDPKHSFSTWMVIRFVKGELNLEDIERLSGGLNLYVEAKKNKLIPRDHDLGSIKTLRDFYDLVEKFRSNTGTGVSNNPQEVRMLKQARVLLDNASYRVLCPETKEAAQWFGRNTDWCTAYGGEHSRHPTRTCQYAAYAAHPLYIIEHKPTGELWQFSFSHSQFMDSRDYQINKREWFAAHHEAAQAIGMGNFRSWLSEIGIQWFDDATLSAISDAEISKAVYTPNDLLRIPETRWTKMEFLRGFFQNHMGDVAKPYVKTLLAIFAQKINSDTIIEALTSYNAYHNSSFELYFPYFPESFQTMANKEKLAKHLTVSQFDRILAKPWSNAIKQLYYREGARSGLVKPSEVEEIFLDDQTLLDGLRCHPSELKQFRKRISIEDVIILIRTIKPHGLVSLIENVPTDMITKEVSQAYLDMAKGTHSWVESIYEGFVHIPVTLWPWKNKAALKSIVKHWTKTFTDLPQPLQTSEMAMIAVKAKSLRLSELQASLVNADIIQAAFAKVVRGSLMINNPAEFGKTLAASKPANVTPELIEDLVLKAENAIGSIYISLPKAYRTRKIIEKMVETGSLDITAPEFPSDMMTPEAIHKAMIPKGLVVRQRASQTYHRNQPEQQKKQKAKEYLADLKETIWDVIPKAKQNEDTLSALITNYPELALAVDTKLLGENLLMRS